MRTDEAVGGVALAEAEYEAAEATAKAERARKLREIHGDPEEYRELLTERSNSALAVYSPTPTPRGSSQSPRWSTLARENKFEVRVRLTLSLTNANFNPTPNWDERSCRLPS